MLRRIRFFDFHDLAHLPNCDESKIMQEFSCRPWNDSVRSEISGKYKNGDRKNLKSPSRSSDSILSWKEKISKSGAGRIDMRNSIADLALDHEIFSEKVQQKIFEAASGGCVESRNMIALSFISSIVRPLSSRDILFDFSDDVFQDVFEVVIKLIDRHVVFCDNPVGIDDLKKLVIPAIHASFSRAISILKSERGSFPGLEGADEIIPYRMSVKKKGRRSLESSPIFGGINGAPVLEDINSVPSEIFDTQKREEMCLSVEKATHGLGPRYEAVLSMRLEGKTNHEIGRVLGVSGERIRQMECEIFDKSRKIHALKVRSL